MRIIQLRTWFSPSALGEPYAEKLRAAQWAATMEFLPISALPNALSAVVCATAMFALGIQSAVGWIAAVLIVLLAIPAARAWHLAHKSPPRMHVSTRDIRSIHIFWLLNGILWTAGYLGTVQEMPLDVALMATCLLLIHSFIAVLAFNFFPWACVAYLLPLVLVAWAGLLLMTARPIGVNVFMVTFVAALAFYIRFLWRSFVASVQTMIEKEELTQQLRVQKEIAEIAVTQKSRFLAAASHDLRQPMHAISLYLGGLSELELPPRARRAVADARDCAYNMNDMFRSLLDISRMDAQQSSPAPSVFPVSMLLERVEREFAPLAASRHIALRVRHCDANIYSDPSMLERIILNFASNAIRYTSRGGVLVGCRRKGNSLRICVYDTGRGVDPAHHESIFDEFSRLERKDVDGVSGLGLGLAIVRRLSSSLRAPVSLRSTPGRGSMFAVDVPLVPVAAKARTLPASEALEPEPELAEKLVVVIDDEKAILHAVTFVLEKAGCHVIAALSFTAAMEQLACINRVPDAIVCDYELRSGTRGTQTIQALREEFAVDIPAVLVTGDTSGEAYAEGLKLGFKVLFKPLEPDALKRSISGLMGAEA